MNNPHSHRTGKQQLAIKRLLARMQSMHPAGFSMKTQLEVKSSDKNLIDCNTYGCIAGQCVIANLRHLKANNTGGKPPMFVAAELMGLTGEETRELFVPDTPDAYFARENKEKKRHIDHARATLAVKHFYHVGTIEWNAKKLKAWDIKQKADNLPEAMKCK